MKTLHICSSVLALFAGVWLISCSSSRNPATAPAPPPASAPQPAANVSTNALATQGEYPGITVAVQELKSSSNALTLKFVMTNQSKQEFAAYYTLHEKEAHSVDGIHLIDPVGKKKYFVVRDSDGACLCSREIQGIAAGAQSVLWAKFPPPPDDVRKMTVEIPHFPPFEDVPVTR